VFDSDSNSEQYCFCELAPLYALNLLSEQERRWVEQQIIDFPELAEELEYYDQSIAPLPYSALSCSPSADLKNRLFDRLSLPPLPLPPQVPSPPPFFTLRSHELNWQPHRVPKVSVAIVHTDPIKREVVGILRAEPGMIYPTHIHAAIEEIYMLEGDLVIGEEIYGTGDYIRSSPGSAHAPYSNGGCMFFFHTSMDDQYPE
jgi:ChrR Cupin-like domain